MPCWPVVGRPVWTTCCRAGLCPQRGGTLRTVPPRDPPRRRPRRLPLGPAGQALAPRPRNPALTPGHSGLHPTPHLRMAVRGVWFVVNLLSQRRGDSDLTTNPRGPEVGRDRGAGHRLLT